MWGKGAGWARRRCARASGAAVPPPRRSARGAQNALRGPRRQKRCGRNSRAAPVGMTTLAWWEKRRRAALRTNSGQAALQRKPEPCRIAPDRIDCENSWMRQRARWRDRLRWKIRARGCLDFGR